MPEWGEQTAQACAIGLIATSLEILYFPERVLVRTALLCPGPGLLLSCILPLEVRKERTHLEGHLL
jgi:hypothetical protein